MPDRLVCVKNFPNGTFAEMAKQALEAEGIHALLQVAGGGAIAFHMAAGLPPWGTQGVDLYVMPGDEEKAKEIVKDF